VVGCLNERSFMLTRDEGQALVGQLELQYP
jgi:hypothetical protein